MIFTPPPLLPSPASPLRRCLSSMAAFGAASFGSWLERCALDKDSALGAAIHSKAVVFGLQSHSFLATKLIRLYSACKEIALAESVLRAVPYRNVFLVNAMIRGYSTNCLYQKALDFFFRMGGDVRPDSYTLSCLIKACALSSCSEQGRRIHGLSCVVGFELDLFVANALIAMYGKFGCLVDAVKLFEKMPRRDIVSWNSIIAAFLQNGLELEAMDKVKELVSCGYRVDGVTMVGILAMPLSVPSIRELHCFIVRKGYESSTVIWNSLISAYGKSGRLREARFAFDHSVKPDAVTWNSIICSYAQNGRFGESLQLMENMTLAGFDADVVTYSSLISSFAQCGHSNEAMNSFQEMLDKGLKPDIITIASVLPAVSDLGYYGYCKEMHAYSYRNAFESDRRVKNALLSGYSNCQSIAHATNVFSNIVNRDVISWSSMVVGYCQNKYFTHAVDTFRQMIISRMEPNPVAITSILSACAGLCSIRLGKEVHLWALKNGFENNTFVGSALIDMYAKCGRVGEAENVFDLMEEKNLVTLNTLVAGYAVNGLGEKALEVFYKVENPDQVSFLAALSACSHSGLADEGIKIFDSMKNFNISPLEGHYTSMVNMLGLAGRLEQALNLIRESPVKVGSNTWAALMGACRVHTNSRMGMYAGNQLIKSGCDHPGHYVLLSNLLADSGKWIDVEQMRKVMRAKGMQKEVACSWV